MKPTQELVTEHQAVLLALKILEQATTALATQGGPAVDHLTQLLDFFAGFVDRCHHGKEEDVLFPALVERGMPRNAGPIAVMLMEHEAGRGQIRAMADGLERLRHGDTSAVAAIQAIARAYIDLLQGHIHKENDILFPMAERVLDDESAAAITEQFEGIERDRVGAGRHEAYHEMLRALKDAYGIR